MSFQISALGENQFANLFALDEAQLQARGARRYIADRTPGFPCRVSLEDAVPGETVVLVPFTHQPADPPYLASGPIFVREAARQALMVDADLTDGRELEAVVARFWDDPRVDCLHVHFAQPGCYACRIDRS